MVSHLRLVPRNAEIIPISFSGPEVVAPDPVSLDLPLIDRELARRKKLYENQWAELLLRCRNVDASENAAGRGWTQAEEDEWDAYFEALGNGEVELEEGPDLSNEELAEIESEYNEKVKATLGATTEKIEKVLSQLSRLEASNQSEFKIAEAMENISDHYWSGNSTVASMISYALEQEFEWNRRRHHFIALARFCRAIWKETPLWVLEEVKRYYISDTVGVPSYEQNIEDAAGELFHQELVASYVEKILDN